MTTLINTTQGVIAVVDERPKAQHPYYNTIKGEYFSHAYFTEDTDHTIIASTFGVGKELYVEYFGWAGLDRMRIDRFIEVWEREEKKYIDFTKPYEYTETETNVIIKL